MAAGLLECMVGFPHGQLCHPVGPRAAAVLLIWGGVGFPRGSHVPGRGWGGCQLAAGQAWSLALMSQREGLRYWLPMLVNEVERAALNGCRQLLCPQGQSQLLLASLRGTRRLASGRDLNQATLKLLALCYNSESVRFCMQLLRMESLFPIACGISLICKP